MHCIISCALGQVLPALSEIMTGIHELCFEAYGPKSWSNSLCKNSDESSCHIHVSADLPATDHASAP